MINSVRVKTRKEMVSMLKWIFFRDESSIKSFDTEKTSFTPLEILQYLDATDGIDFAKFTETERESTAFYRATDDIECVKKFVLESGSVGLIKNFLPGTLTWMFSDPCTNFNTRAFIRPVFKYARDNDIGSVDDFFLEVRNEQFLHDSKVKEEDLKHKNEELNLG